MVRLKQRYLLLNILYPTSHASTSVPASNTNTTTLLPHTTSSTSTPSFLKFHAPTPQHLTPQLFLTLLRNQLTLLYGDHGLGIAQSSLKVIYFSNATSTVILRVPRGGYRLVWAGLSHLGAIPGDDGVKRGGGSGRGRGGRQGQGYGQGRDSIRDDIGGSRDREKEIACVFRVVRVSGTIRKIEEELIRRGRREIVRARLAGERVLEAGKESEIGGMGYEDDVEGMDEDEDEDESE